MMDTIAILNIVVTVVLFVLLMVAIVKKFDIIFGLLFISLLGYIYLEILTGASVVETTTGSLFLDIFAVMEEVVKNNFASTMLPVMFVIGYVEYMEKLGTTKLVCLSLKGPLKKLNKPYLVMAGVIIITAVLKWSIMSGPGQAILLLVTLYPILISIGLTKATAASAIMFAVAVFWGPGNGLTAMWWGFGGITDYTMAEHFVSYEIPNVFVSMIVAIIVMTFTSKFWDKKEGAVAEDDANDVQDWKELGLPLWYTIFPFVPAVIVVIFSKLVVGSVIVSVGTASVISWFLVILVECIRRKTIKTVLTEASSFWVGVGNFFITSGAMIVVGVMFSTVINKIGGLAYLFNKLFANSANANVYVLIIVAALGCFAFNAISGNNIGGTSLFGALLSGVVPATGLHFANVVRYLMPIGTMGQACSPIATANLIITRQTGVPIGTLVKRTLIPALAYAIASIIMQTFVLPAIV